MNIQEANNIFAGDSLAGGRVHLTDRRLKDLEGVFYDAKAFALADKEEVIYEVASHFPVEEGTTGGLFFGVTKVYPGKVGNEYFMTRGHFHLKGDRAEYYWCISGEGVLLLMSRSGETSAERMSPGTLHYIPAETAHRVANTGEEVLAFGAVWPADAGHDYATIARSGFTRKLIEVDGSPALV